MRKVIWAILLVFAIPVGLSGCNEGPAEDLGENIDDAVNEIDNEI